MSEIIINNVTDAIFARRSIRSYSEIQLTENELNTILESGIWAPTARNQQEIDFYVMRDRKSMDILSEKFSAFTKKDKVQDVSFGAPTMILLFANTGARFMAMDAGIAVENMSLAAQSLGLGSVIVGCFSEFMDSEEGMEYAQSLGVPNNYSFCISIAIGHTVNPTKAQPRREGRLFYI